MPKRVSRVKDRWREKVWVTVQAPVSFGSTPVAYIPITDPKRAIGRVVESTLFDLVKQDPQQHAIKLYFQIERIDDSIAKTVFKGHEYGREYLRSLIRRGSSMISVIDDYTTKDGTRVRVYTVALAQSRLNSSRKHAIRLTARRILTEKTSNLNYDQFAQEAVLGKIASDIYNEAKKISHLRHVGIRKTKLVGKTVRPMELVAETPVIVQPTSETPTPSSQSPQS